MDVSGVKAYCTSAQIAAVVAKLRQQPEDNAKADDAATSPEDATTSLEECALPLAPSRFGQAAAGTASFVEETHVHIGEVSGVLVADLRHCATHLRGQICKKFGKQQYKPQRDWALSTLKILDWFSTAYDVLRHYSRGNLTRLAGHVDALLSVRGGGGSPRMLDVECSFTMTKASAQYVESQTVETQTSHEGLDACDDQLYALFHGDTVEPVPFVGQTIYRVTMSRFRRQGLRSR